MVLCTVQHGVDRPYLPRAGFLLDQLERAQGGGLVAKAHAFDGGLWVVIGVQVNVFCGLV